MNTINKLYVHVDGIYCEHCIETIKLALCSLDGVESTGLRHNVAEISGKCLPPVDLIVDTIREIGYATDKSKISTNRSKVSRTVRWYEFLLIAAAIITVAVGIRLIFGYNIFNAIPTVDSRLSYAMLFVTGLLTSIHCISMCGAIGIFASSESNSVRSFTRPLLYNAGRVISYTVIGGIVGLVGSTFSINATIRGVVILVAAVFMLLIALSIANVLPDEKEAHVRTLQAGGKVAMVGDGINDAPALTRADVGVAIGAGTDVAIESASIVLMNSDLEDVAACVRLGRGTLRNIHENLFWAFFYNLICIPLAAGLFGLKMDPMYGAAAMSLSSVTVCLNALRLNLLKIRDDSHDRPKRKKGKGYSPVKSNPHAVLLSVKGMMCPHCEATVRGALEALDFVKKRRPITPWAR